MDDFGDFCYLDVQKTGSTLISRTLANSSKSPLVSSKKHASIRKSGIMNAYSLIKRGGFYRDGAFYFNSIRNPFKYYASLYNYGVDKRGGLYRLLKKGGLADFYNGTEGGFLKWTAFIMNEKNSRYLGHDYASCGSKSIGLLTYRFLRLSVVAPDSTLSNIRSTDDAYTLHESHNICKFTIRNESLTKDVLYLIDHHLKSHIDRRKALDILEGKRINASKSKIKPDALLGDGAIEKLIRDRDSLIFDHFYPDQ